MCVCVWGGFFIYNLRQQTDHFRVFTLSINIQTVWRKKTIWPHWVDPDRKRNIRKSTIGLWCTSRTLVLLCCREKFISHMCHDRTRVSPCWAGSWDGGMVADNSQVWWMCEWLYLNEARWQERRGCSVTRHTGHVIGPLRSLGTILSVLGFLGSSYHRSEATLSVSAVWLSVDVAD